MGGDLHILGYGLPVREDVAQVFSSQHISQCCRGQQPRGGSVVVNIDDSTDSVLHLGEVRVFNKQQNLRGLVILPCLVIHDCVDEHRHAVFGQDLRNIYKYPLVRFVSPLEAGH